MENGSLRDLKKFLDLEKNILEVDLSTEECSGKELIKNMIKINRLFNIALYKDVGIYFDGGAVEEPPDDMEFTFEEEFFYNNKNSYFVFFDDTGTKVRFKVTSLANYDFETVYKIAEKAVKYTMEHPEVSKYKLRDYLK